LRRSPKGSARSPGTVKTSQPKSFLPLDASVLWVDEATQKERAGEIAKVILHDLEGERSVNHWRTHVPRGLLGWAPTKVPLRAKELSYRNCRYVTPKVAEILEAGERTGFRREHIVSRSELANLWSEAETAEKISEIVMEYRFAVVLTTIEESAHIDRVGGRQGRTERYLAADISVVYDRKQGSEVHVTTLDPALRKSKG